MGNLLCSRSSEILDVCAIYTSGFLLPAASHLTHYPSPSWIKIKENSKISTSIAVWNLEP